MWDSLAVAILCTLCVSVTGAFNENCGPVNFQTDVDIDTLMGMWIGAEEITHTNTDDYYRDEMTNKSVSRCPIINILDATHEMTTTETPYRPGEYGYQQRRQPGRSGQSWNPTGRPSDRSFRYLRLTWSEDRKTIVYYLQYNNSARGYWLSTSPYRGDPLDYTYNQFTGTVQVMKAVKDHLVLYFCERLPDSRQFTIVLSRQLRQLNSQDIHSIHSLLRRRGLSVTHVTKVCNSVNGLQSSAFVVALTILLAVWKTYSHAN